MTFRRLTHPDGSDGEQAAPVRAVTAAARPVPSTSAGPAPVPMQNELPAGVYDVTPSPYAGGGTTAQVLPMTSGLAAALRDVTPAPFAGVGTADYRLPMRSGLPAGVYDVTPGRITGGGETAQVLPMTSGLPAGVRDVTPGGGAPGSSAGCSGCAGARGGACACGGSCDGCNHKRSGQCGGCLSGASPLSLARGLSDLPAGVRDVTPGRGPSSGCPWCAGARGGGCACGGKCDGCSQKQSGQCAGCSIAGLVAPPWSVVRAPNGLPLGVRDVTPGRDGGPLATRLGRPRQPGSSTESSHIRCLADVLGAAIPAVFACIDSGSETHLAVADVRTEAASAPLFERMSRRDQ